MKYLNLKNIIIICIVIGASMLIGFQSEGARQYMNQSFFVEKENIRYTDFLQMINDNKVTNVIIKNEETIQFISQQKKYLTQNPNTENFKEFLLLNNINVSYNRFNISSILSLVFVIGVFAGVYVLINKKNKKDQLVTSSVVNKAKEKSTLIKFENVAGNVEAKSMVRDIIDFLKDNEKYENVGANMPKGILLYGPPGTGKTLLAKAIAGEADVPFYALSGSDFVQMYVGVGAKRVRDLFAKARKSKKAIIFIDEIDALGKGRSNQSTGNNDERDQTLNALLTEMSGFKSGEGVIVIGATNRVDILDSALLRPGRFDRKIEVSLPDVVARKDILGLYLKNKPIADDVIVEKLAQKTSSFSGAMLAHLINEAAILTANNQETIVSNARIQEAFYNVVAGRNKSCYKNKSELKVTAVHEAGHALITKLLKPDITIDKVTIIPTVNGAAGFNYNIEKDKMYQTKIDILYNIQILLAGRAAEEIIFGENYITTGCLNDVKVASKRVYDYFKLFGMDEDFGLFNYEGITEETILYEKCRKKIKMLYKETKEILKKQEQLLKNITEKLYEKETLTGEDVDNIINSLVA